MSKEKALGIPELPQVNLLPPEVRAKRAAGHARRWMLLALAIAVAVSGLAYLYALMESRTAGQELATAEAETAALVAEQATLAHVPRVLDEWDNVVRAQNYAMVGEVLWAPYLRAMTAVMPVEVGLGSISITSVRPDGTVDLAENILATPGAAQLHLSGSALLMPDTANWMDALDTIPGIRDVYYYQQPIEEKDGLVYYNWEVTAVVDASALSLRHAIDGEVLP